MRFKSSALNKRIRLPISIQNIVFCRPNLNPIGSCNSVISRYPDMTNNTIPKADFKFRVIALIIGIGVVTIILARKRRQRRKEFMDDLFGKK